MFLIIYPLYLVCIASVSDPDAIVAGKVIWHPVDFSLIGYKAVLEYTEFWSSYRNSFIYTISSVVISIIVTLTAAYSLSRPKFPGKAAINMFFVITMFFNGGLIPTFLVMKDIGMYNNPLVMILMGCVSVWNLMVARTFIQTNIPEELYEASALDGASHFQYFIKVVMPLSKTIIAVLAVYYGVAKWNDYFTGLVYLKDRSLYPLQTVLREILATLQVDMTGDFMTTMSEDASNLAEATRIANVSKYCIIVLATGPVVVLYAFMQKYFEKHHDGSVDCDRTGRGLGNGHQIQHFVFSDPMVFIHEFLLHQRNDDITAPERECTQIQCGYEYFPQYFSLGFFFFPTFHATFLHSF